MRQDRIREKRKTKKGKRGKKVKKSEKEKKRDKRRFYTCVTHHLVKKKIRMMKKKNYRNDWYERKKKINEGATEWDKILNPEN